MSVASAATREHGAEHPHHAIGGPALAGQFTGQESRATGAGSRRWYVVHTKPHAEDQATFHLERQGYRIFCPRVRRTVRHARKVTRVLAPLFPGYLFLDLDVSCEQWRCVNGTFGVVRLIMQGENPEPVPVGIVEALQGRSAIDGAISWGAELKVGQVVRIAEGPLMDLMGTLERLDSAGRVQVLLSMLGRSVTVTLRSETLLPTT